MAKLLSIKEASKWASEYLGKNITPSNISYLIQYGKIKKIRNNGSIQVIKEELIEYYKSKKNQEKKNGKNSLVMI